MHDFFSTYAETKPNAIAKEIGYANVKRKGVPQVVKLNRPNTEQFISVLVKTTTILPPSSLLSLFPQPLLSEKNE